MVEMVPVASSSISAIGYDEPSGTLLVRFHNGARTYRYAAVPAVVHRSFLAAASKGRFFSTYVKGHHGYARVA